MIRIIFRKGLPPPAFFELEKVVYVLEDPRHHKITFFQSDGTKHSWDTSDIESWSEITEKDPEAWREVNLKKQAAGVKFEVNGVQSLWCFKYGNKEQYREVQEAPKPTIPPHAKERALYWSQQVAGTNEVWQEKDLNNEDEWGDLPMGVDPAWSPECMYRVKPKTVTCCTVNIELDPIRFEDKQALENCLNNFFTIIGNIEIREVEV